MIIQVCIESSRLIDWFAHFRENCPTGIIPEWMQKVTQHNEIMQEHNQFKFPKIEFPARAFIGNPYSPFSELAFHCWPNKYTTYDMYDMLHAVRRKNVYFQGRTSIRTRSHPVGVCRKPNGAIFSISTYTVYTRLKKPPKKPPPSRWRPGTKLAATILSCVCVYKETSWRT